MKLHQPSAPTLSELEALIDNGRLAYIEVGNALRDIQQRKLYREQGYKTFADYCAGRWGFSRSVGYDYINAARTAENVGSTLQTPLSLTQAVTLARLDPEEQRAIATQTDFAQTSVRQLQRKVGKRIIAKLPKTELQPMKCAYADPPYLGCANFYKEHHPDALAWDNPETHRALITRLVTEFPDGWAMSASSPSLRTILPMCPDDCRVSCWVKPFASFKPGIGVAYAWEPVIWRGGRVRTRDQDTIRDWHSANITMEKGLPGAKPESFCQWLFQTLNLNAVDELVDIFRAQAP